MQRQTGKKPKALDIPPCPPELRYLWLYWCDIHGPELLSYTELQAWSALNQVLLTPFDVGVIRRLDVLFFETRSAT